MLFRFSSTVAATALFTSAIAAPSVPSSSLSKRGFDCSSLAYGLTQEDCEHMSQIGMAGQGANANSPNGGIWIGSEGPNTFDFQNGQTSDVIVIFWNNPQGDFQSSFMNVRKPQVSYSLGPGKSITISMANDISGGWAGIYDRQTTLTQFGQIQNTWGEVTTGSYGTVDVSRLVHMQGDNMSIVSGEGAQQCVSDFSKCYFSCKSGNSCGYNAGEVDLMNCEPNSQPGANFGWRDGNASGGQPEGGCSPSGLRDGNGKVTINL